MSLHPKQTVLVVEDQALVRMEAVDVLTDHGYEVLEGSDADDALAILEARGSDIRVMFTDIHIQGAMSGLELAHRVHRRWPGIGLLLTSGLARPPLTELPDGSRFLAKAYDSSHVVAKVQQLIAGA